MGENKIFENISNYSRMNKLSVFVGAGVSRLSGYPSWYNLVQSMADEIGCIYKKDKKGNGIFSSEELLKIPQIYFLNKGKVNYKIKIEDGFKNSCIPNEIHHLILSLQPNHILTTNYDTLLEETAIKFGRNFSIINSDKVVSKAETENYLLKVHGDFSSDFVLKEQDYLDYENNYVLIENMMKTIFATNLVIFIGYGLNDYNIKLILNWVKRVQSDSFVKPVFIHTGNKLNDLEIAYQESRGLHIIDCNDYIDSTSCIDGGDYIPLYKVVLEEILSFNPENNLHDDAAKLQFIFSKLSGIRNLNYIRKEDFNNMFKGAYELNDEWKIINKTKTYDVIFDDKKNVKKTTKNRLDYFERFYSNDEQFKAINDKQFNYVHSFLESIGVVGIDSEASLSIPKFTINSSAFKNQYKEMKEFCLLDYDDLNDNFTKAYFYAQIGEYADSYSLFTDILEESKRLEQWEVYYFSLINRHYLYSIILQMKARTTGFIGSINFGKSLKLFDDDFIKNLNLEMANNKMENLFFELPFEFKSNYAFLHDFSEKNCYLKKYYSFTKEKYEIDKSLQKDVLSFGISKFDKLKVDMLDTTKFLYENMLLFSHFAENKLYIKNTLLSWLEAYAKEVTKSKDGYFGIFSNSRYEFTITDIILITKSFKMEDINYLLAKIDIANILFEDVEVLENYIRNQINMYKDLFKETLNGAEIFIWKIFSNEIKLLLMISPFFVKNNDCKIDAVKFIISMRDLNYTVSDRIRIITKWTQNANACNVAPIIENWFFSKVDPVIKGEVQECIMDRENSDITMIAWLLGEVAQKEVYDIQSISEIIVENSENPYLNTKCFEGLYSLLNVKAKYIYDSKCSIDNLHELMQRGYAESIPIGFDQNEMIEKYFTEILEKRIEDSNSDIRTYSFPSNEDQIGEVAAYMLTMNFSHEITSKYNGVSHEYDFLLNPDGFNIDNFRIDWLFTYSNNLLEKLKNHHFQRKVIIEMVNVAIIKFEYDASKLKRLFEIYKIVMGNEE